MDKHALSYYLLDNIENDEFLQRKYKELLIAYSKSLFSEYSEKYTDEYKKLLRYADMLSLSEKEKHQNIAQQIVILLLCTDKGNCDVQYALGGISNQIFASKYVLYMPDKEQLIAQVEKVLESWHGDNE